MSALRVVVDVGPAVHQRAGLSRYSERLVANLRTYPLDELDLTVFYNQHSNHWLPDSLHGMPMRTVTMGQLAWRLSALATQWLRWPRYERILPPSHLYHATEHLLPYLHRPTVLTVHDLIFEHYPEYHTQRNRLFLHTALPRFVRAAHRIIAVSEQTKRDLIELYGTPAEKVQVIYEGIDPAFAPAAPAVVAQVSRQYSPNSDQSGARPYLLMVGTLEPRKNHLTAMRALARLKAHGFPHRLLIVGGEGWLFEPIRAKVAELGLEQDVTFAGHVPFADLVALYSGADCVLMPSLFEGFGFPVLEAMACGTPVVCSNTSSLPEVAGDVALTIPPTDDAAWAEAIQRVLREPGLRADLRERGLRWAGQFTWQRCAAETLALYRACVQANRSG